MPEVAEITRQAVRTPRAAAVAGIVFSLLMPIPLIVVRTTLPSDAEASHGWVISTSQRNGALFALSLLPFAAIAFLWFIGVVRDRIGAAEDRFFATVFFGSGVIFIVMLLMSGALAGGLVAAAADTRDPAVWQIWSFGRRVTQTLIQVYAMRMAAVFVISTTTLAMRLGLVPKWLAVFGYLVGALLMLTVGLLPWVELAFPIWVLVLSLHILVVTFRSSASSAAPTPATAT